MRENDEREEQYLTKEKMSIDDEMNNTQHLEFICKILRKEIKYAAMRELYEGKSLRRFSYPFGILEQGIINAEKFDVTKIFPYVDVHPDLSFRYNEKNILKRLAEQEHHLSNEDVKLLNTRFYGTDYRLVLLYRLCQRKFFIEQGMTDELMLHTHNW